MGLSLHPLLRAGYRLWWRLARRLGRVRPATQPDMGATPGMAGVTFRVWAPHADLVAVSGDFNGWSTWRHPLLPAGGGVWAADVPEAAAGAAYKIALRQGRRLLMRSDPYARKLDGPFRNSLALARPTVSPPPPLALPPREGLIIYELHVGTFNPAEGRPPGRFADVIERLPYLAELGINAIELMPVAEFAGDFSWGYNPSHPYVVSETYGGAAGLAALVAAAHARGIAVILDVVYNHFGPQDLDLWHFDGWQENGLGGLYFYNDWRSRTPWGDTRPDYGRPEVQRYILDNVLMWLDEFGLDGLRWDATSYIRNAHGHDGDAGSDIPEGWRLMQEANAATRARRPARLTIAEDMRGNPWLTRPEGEGGAGFAAQWDERFVHPVRAALITPLDEGRDLAAVRGAILANYDGDPWRRVIYTESHDEVANGKARVPEEIAPGDAGSRFARQRAGVGLALVFTTPGIPMLFQGQEFGEGGWFEDTRAVDWGGRRRGAGLWRLTRDLIALRRNRTGMTRGLMGRGVNVFHLDQAAGILAFHRWDRGGAADDVVVVVNLTNRTVVDHAIGLPRAGLWHVRLNSGDRRYGVDLDGVRCPALVAEAAPRDDLRCQGRVTLGPYAAVILSQG